MEIISRKMRRAIMRMNGIIHWPRGLWGVKTPPSRPRSGRDPAIGAYWIIMPCALESAWPVPSHRYPPGPPGHGAALQAFSSAGQRVNVWWLRHPCRHRGFSPHWPSADSPPACIIALAPILCISASCAFVILLPGHGTGMSPEPTHNQGIITAQ